MPSKPITTVASGGRTNPMTSSGTRLVSQSARNFAKLVGAPASSNACWLASRSCHAAGHEAPGVELLCGPVPRPQAVLAGEEKGERLVTEPAVLEIFETLCHQARELCEQSGLALAGAGERDEQGMILLVLSAPFLSCSC